MSPAGQGYAPDWRLSPLFYSQESASEGRVLPRIWRTALGVRGGGETPAAYQAAVCRRIGVSA